MARDLRVTMKATHWLNTRRVQNAIGKAASRAATRQFYIIRREARDLLGRKVKRAKPRPPGKPPRHRTPPGFKLIQGNYDFRRRRTVIGPTIFVKQHGQGVPGVHEHGKRHGTVLKVSARRKGRPLTSDKAKRAFLRKVRNREITLAPREKVYKRIKYPKRPFMFAALRNVKGKLADTWKNTFRK